MTRAKAKPDRAEEIAREMVKVQRLTPSSLYGVFIVNWELDGLTEYTESDLAEEVDYIVADLAAALRRAGVK